MAEVNYDNTPLISSTNQTTYNYNEKQLKTNSIKVKCRGTNSRYSGENSVIIRIQYYKETSHDVFEPGEFQNINIIPYASGSEVNYDYEYFDLNNNYIKSIQILGDATELSIYKETTIAEEVKEVIQQSGFIIPIVDELPDPTQVENGYVCILRTLLTN